ncbi:CalY family protein [Bacillus sp. Marseille-Q3570]|uniref:CalY family protein n=1 Tax=Bacillus sp. Marseille-Q3570 TaxID=2963522 RepID=UPI0021B7AEAA|nr:CalY family protein [Bacillus sp. Marseille-Q3570]
MSIKKKLGMGVATAALGLSLVGGGTWAAFNDTATINNHFAAGTLDLEVGHVNQGANFDLTNMKPGDSIKRVFNLNNAGSLAIKEVLLNTTADDFTQGDGTNSDLNEFLKQFEIDALKVDSENTDGKFEPRESIVVSGQTLTLYDLVNASYSGKIKSDYIASDGTGRINLAPLVVPSGETALRGIPVVPEDMDSVMFVITFKDDQTRTGGAYSEFVQNKFQGNSANFWFNLEATQWDGMNLDSSHGSGAINNGVQGSSDADNSTEPSQLVKPGSTVSEPVTD